MQHNTVSLKGVPIDQAAPVFAPLNKGIFDGNRSDPPPLPLEAFRGWSEWIAVASEKSGAPADYPAIGLLAAASTLIGNSRWVSPWDGWKEPPVLWLCAVGDPSSNKSPGLDVTFEILSKFEMEMAENFPDELREYERKKEIAGAERAKWKAHVTEAINSDRSPLEMPEEAVEPEPPVRPRLMVSDATPEALGGLISRHPKGLLCKRDELSAQIASFDRYSGGGERGFFIEAYGGRRHTVDRVKNAAPIQIKRLTLGFVGGIQPEKLAELIGKCSDDGFLARFLMSWPNPIPPRRPTSPPISPAYETALRNLMALEMAQDEDGEPVPRVIMFTDEASAKFQEWREENAAAEGHVYGLMRSHNGKLPGMVLRLAITLEYLHWCLDGGREPEAIGMAAVGRAIYLVDEYFFPMAMRVYGEAALPPVEKAATILARRIRRERASVVNVSEMLRFWKLPGLTRKEPMAEALAVLEECGVLARTTERHKDNRLKLDYIVNPEIYGADHK